MGDAPGELQLAREAVEGATVARELGLEELERDPFLNLGVEDLVDAAHAATPQLLDDLVPTGQRRASWELAGDLRSGGRFRKSSGAAGPGSRSPQAPQ